MSDDVNRPAHYTQHAVECIDVIEMLDLGFHVGNVLKYLWRAKHKGNYVRDLEKARWYLDREIERAKKWGGEK